MGGGSRGYLLDRGDGGGAKERRRGRGIEYRERKKTYVYIYTYARIISGLAIVVVVASIYYTIRHCTHAHT